MLHERYMRRCLDLASNATGTTGSNPLVGAVIVHNDRIIGEGIHSTFGAAHAEVKAVDAVNDDDKRVLSDATLYVNLEPCSHYGKTPPCTKLILQHKIKTVVVGAGDPNPLVNGEGIRQLRDARVAVIENVLADECVELNKRFYTFHEKKRPYVILKWAQSADGFIATKPLQRVQLSNATSQVFSHKWRSEESAILVGYNTALTDNPKLNTRLWPGKHPLRLVYDPQLHLHDTLNLFDHSTPTWIMNSQKEASENNLTYKRVAEENWVQETLKHLYDANCLSVIVEGGTNTLNAFIHQGVWDEARVFTTKVALVNGLPAPTLLGFTARTTDTIGDNLLNVYLR